MPGRAHVRAPRLPPLTVLVMLNLLLATNLSHGTRLETDGADPSVLERVHPCNSTERALQLMRNDTWWMKQGMVTSYRSVRTAGRNTSAHRHQRTHAVDTLRPRAGCHETR